MVVDLDEQELARIRELLAAEHQRGVLVYGVHVAGASLMTCAISAYQGNHVHFIDGADGGYALAAKQLEQSSQVGASPGRPTPPRACCSGQVDSHASASAAAPSVNATGPCQPEGEVGTQRVSPSPPVSLESVSASPLLLCWAGSEKHAAIGSTLAGHREECRTRRLYQNPGPR